MGRRSGGGYQQEPCEAAGISRLVARRRGDFGLSGRVWRQPDRRRVIRGRRGGANARADTRASGYLSRHDGGGFTNAPRWRAPILRLCFYQQPDRDTFERLLANAAMASWTMQRNVPRIAVPAEKALSATRVPLLFIYGQHDALVNPAASLKRASAINPHIRSDIYANAGHAPFMEDAARFNAQLAAFADNAVARVSRAHPR